MNNQPKENFQYNSCREDGLCSLNPRTSALQEILVLYLRLVSFYIIELQKKNYHSDKARNIIINTISIIVSNFEISDEDFKSLNNGYKVVLKELSQKYIELGNNKNNIPKILQDFININLENNITSFVNLGEKEFLKDYQHTTIENRNLYQILFTISKSICINFLDLETYGIESEEGFNAIVETLNFLNNTNNNLENIKKHITEIVTTNNSLIKLLDSAQIKRYGIPREKSVSYSTIPNKAILVVGSNIRELEDILDITKDKNIDIYTHDNMILANTFPFFNSYSHLKGQYGQGLEDCLLDFATFPGPIILTRHSLHNFANLYRGKLYSTDIANSKGIISIKNKNFTPVIESAYNSKGFKTGKTKKNKNIGYNFDELIETIKNQKNKYTQLIILGSTNEEKNEYFDKFLAKIPKNILVLSLTNCIKKENVICINSNYDSFAPTKIINTLKKETKIPITMFFPKCDNHTISQIVYLITELNIKIYMGKCTPILLNPNILKSFKKIFKINSITTPQKDIEKILQK